jgi:hypothetical protein
VESFIKPVITRATEEEEHGDLRRELSAAITTKACKRKPQMEASHTAVHPAVHPVGVPPQFEEAGPPANRMKDLIGSVRFERLDRLLFTRTIIVITRYRDTLRTNKL